MKIILQRFKEDHNQTTGVLTVVDANEWPVFVCPCIERGWQDNKRNISSVPPGTYTIVREWSPRFKAYLYELKGVPNRAECKIHASNYWHQLNGCIAPGAYLKDLDGDTYKDVAASRRTLNDFHRVLEGIEKTTIEVRSI